MKKLTLLLLLVPILSFGQISYKDIMKLDSKDAYQKLMIDKKMSITEKTDNYFQYALTPRDKDGKTVSTLFGEYYDDAGLFSFSFIRTGYEYNPYTGDKIQENIVVSNSFDPIQKKVERKCRFIKIVNIGEIDFACYLCNDAKFRGYLGLGFKGNQGIVQQLLLKQVYPDSPLISNN